MPSGFRDSEARFNMQAPRGTVGQASDELRDQILGSRSNGGHRKRSRIRQPLACKGRETHRRTNLDPRSGHFQRQHGIAHRFQDRCGQCANHLLLEEDSGFGSTQDEMHGGESVGKRKRRRQRSPATAATSDWKNPLLVLQERMEVGQILSLQTQLIRAHHQ